MILPPLTKEQRSTIRWIAKYFTPAQIAEAIVRDPFSWPLLLNDIKDANSIKSLPRWKTRLARVEKELNQSIGRGRLTAKRWGILYRESLKLTSSIRFAERCLLKDAPATTPAQVRASGVSDAT
jgi:hypothetical protein